MSYNDCWGRRSLVISVEGAADRGEAEVSPVAFVGNALNKGQTVGLRRQHVLAMSCCPAIPLGRVGHWSAVCMSGA